MSRRGRAARGLAAPIGLVLLSTGGAKALDVPGLAGIVATYDVLPAATPHAAVVLVVGTELALGA